MATTDAPKPTFAQMARRAERCHRGEEEGRRRKRVDAREPRDANDRRRVFRWGALWGGEERGSCWWRKGQGDRGKRLTVVCDSAH
jgi:hypothetical protein